MAYRYCTPFLFPHVKFSRLKGLASYYPFDFTKSFAVEFVYQPF